MQYWFEYRFPLNLLIDLGNLSIVLLIVNFFIQKYKIPLNLKIILLLSCFTPFIFNGLLFEWYVFPDQTKYLRSATNCRDLDCFSKTNPLIASGIIYAISPIISLEGFKSIAFANRLFFILFILFLYLKKIDNIFLFILIFLPGLILYSSLSIRDTLVIILSILSFYYFFEKKFLVFLVNISFLFLLKYQTAFYIFASLLTYYFVFNHKVKLPLKISILILFIFLIFNNLGLITDILNEKRHGFYHEEFNDVSNFENLTALGLILSIPKSIFQFLISPLPDINSFKMFFVLLDTLILYLITLIIFALNFDRNYKKSLFWIFFLLGLIALHGLIVFNDGTIHRYKIVIVIPILFSYLYSLKKND